MFMCLKINRNKYSELHALGLFLLARVGDWLVTAQTHWWAPSLPLRLEVTSPPGWLVR